MHCAVLSQAGNHLAVIKEVSCDDAEFVEFSIAARDLRDALATARSVTPAAPSLIAHSGVLLLVKGERLSVIGADGDTAIAASRSLTGATDGEVLLTPRPLAGFLAEIPGEAKIHFTADGVDATVTVEGIPSPYTFRAIQARFPRPPAAKSAPKKASFGMIGDAVAAVRAATDRDHGGVQLISTDKDLTFVATDLYQLHTAHVAGAGFGEFNGVVPLRVFERVAVHEIDGVVADSKGRTLRFSGPEILISTRLLSVAMPNTENVLASAPPTEVVVGVEPLLKKLKRLMSVTGTEPASVVVTPGKLSLAAANPDAGSGAELIEIPSAVSARVVLDPHRLSTSLAAHQAETVKLLFGGELEPVFIRSKSYKTTVTTVVSPIRT